MNSLENILGNALSASRFDIGRLESDQGHPLRSYEARPDEIVSVDQLRQVYQEEARAYGDGNLAKSAHLICDEGPISEVTNLLRDELDRYIDAETGHIGHAFPLIAQSGGQGWAGFQEDGLLLISAITPLGSFARALVKGSALVGSESIASLVSRWAEGDPIRYRTCAILNGVYIEEPCNLCNGVNAIVLPSSTPELAKYLRSFASTQLDKYAGRTMVVIDSSVSPPLFRPNDDDGRNKIRALTQFGGDAEIVCQALSLLSDVYVDAEACWNDYLHLGDWLPSNLGFQWSLSSGIPRHRWQNGRLLHKNQENDKFTVSGGGGANLEYPESYPADVLDALTEPQFRTLRTVTSRWMKSKNPSDGMVDQFVDLRMALEALFLRDFSDESSGEMGFRLALFGAWFLGADFQDRQLIRKKLRDAYRRASGAIHTGDVNSTPSHRELLTDAQSLCRRAILKLLEQGFPEDWGDLVLGSAIPAARD